MLNIPVEESADTIPGKSEKLARRGLTLALLGMVCLGPLTGIPAVICAHVARRRLADRTDTRAYRDASSALFLGYLSTALFCIGLFLLWILVPIVIELFRLDRLF